MASFSTKLARLSLCRYSHLIFLDIDYASNIELTYNALNRYRLKAAAMYRHRHGHRFAPGRWDQIIVQSQLQ